MLGYEGALAGIWILIVGPAVFGLVALVGLLLVLRSIKLRRSCDQPTGGLTAFAMILALVVFGIGSCYGLMLTS